jgi:environmental stress-induced protein Ves
MESKATALCPSTAALCAFAQELRCGPSTRRCAPAQDDIAAAVHVIRFETYLETPWKNGGGITHEIARCDGGAGPEWRVSLATIDSDGPFSDFSGYDRTIVPLDGAGFELTFDDGERVVLDQRYEPYRFAGEKKVECRLLAGRSRDLNAMTRRAAWQHDVRAIALSEEPRAFDATAPSLLFAAGAVRVRYGSESIDLRDGDTLACDVTTTLSLTAIAPGAVVLAIAFILRG